MDKSKMIPIENDLMFSSVMRNEDACIRLLQAIFPDKEIEKIEYLEDFDREGESIELQPQKFLQVNPLSKSVRLDLYFKNSDTVYNVELQKTDKKNIAHRARYYSSIIDGNLLERGMTYNQLLDSYVIFLCTFDPFDRDRYIYKFSSICQEEDLCEGNGRYNIYLNTKGSKGDINFDLEKFFEYINGGVAAIGRETDSKLLKTIDGYVKEFNGSGTWRKGFMKWELMLKENYEKGVADEKTKAKEKEAQNIRNMYEDNVPISKIGQYFSLSEDEVRDILSVK